MHSRMTLATIGTALAMVPTFATGQTIFTQEDKESILKFWGDPSRYRVESPDNVAKEGKFQVRLTAEGSLWLWNYNRARGLGKTPPGQTPPPLNDRETRWEKWIDAKVAFDRFNSYLACKEQNDALNLPTTAVASAPNPGPVPADLKELAGVPPAFASAVAPNKHVIDFGDSNYSYNDNPPMRIRYAYYRFPQGVMKGGKAVKEMPAEELSQLLKDSGLTETDGKVLRSVSLLEGGFESVNTYDTGFVSVGLIQFATLSAGAGSLGAVLAHLERSNPTDFHQNFRQYGIEVSETGVLQVLCPTTGNEFEGPDAIKRIIDDKRLIAVFQRAGEKCRNFRLSQLIVAVEQYHPANDSVKIELGDRVLEGKVGDVFKTEAGIATLMDRKVNTGKLGNLMALLKEAAIVTNAQSLSDLAAYEFELTQAMVFRKNYLTDASLTRPNPNSNTVLSRSGNRGGRGGRSGGG